MEIPTARQASDATISSAGTYETLRKVVIDAIDTSIGAASNSATFSTSGKQGPDVIQIISELRRKGHKVTVSGTTVTISW